MIRNCFFMIFFRFKCTQIDLKIYHFRTDSHLFKTANLIQIIFHDGKDTFAMETKELWNVLLFIERNEIGK